MTLFWIICALLLTAALLFVVLPLWFSRAKDDQVLRDAANLEIFRDQIAEMDADLSNGLLTQELYEQGRRELQTRMLEEVKTPGGAEVFARNPHRYVALALAVVISLAAVGLYLKMGNYEALLPGGASGAMSQGTAHSEAELKELEDKVAQNPKDTDSLGILARTYVEQQRYVDGAKTYNKLTQIVTNDAQLWADFADALAMASGQNLAGHPTILINKALEVDPNNPKALALAGSAAMGRQDYSAAIQYWEKLSKMLQPGSEDAKMIDDGIAQARAGLAQGKGGKPAAQQPGGAAQPVAAGHERISGTVDLAPALKDKASPTDWLFVLARAESGPPMPLAVLRKQVKDLPLQFTLDDSMAMSPQMKLSNFDKVVLVARIAKSGDPMPHPGDLQGTSPVLKPGATGVVLSINSVVK
jgi:cytochrome c-type biogenesis protein CcmH